MAAAIVLLTAHPALAEIRVSGKVELPDGAPAAEAEALLFPVASPLARARAAWDDVAPEPAARALADPAGRFRLIAPAAGLWRVELRATGFVPTSHPLEPLVEPVELPPARLRPDAGVAVKVTERGGGPAAGAIVAAWVERDRF
jgi:hypothetical protein